MGAITSNKKYSEKDKEESDMMAKVAAIKFLEGHGYVLGVPLKDQAERYKAWDFVMQWKGIDVPIEVERKRVWKSSTSWLPYNTIDIPYRKKDTQSKLFVMVNESAEALAICKTSDILSSEVKVKDTTYTSGEKFFAVPTDKFKFYFNL